MGQSKTRGQPRARRKTAVGPASADPWTTGAERWLGRNAISAEGIVPGDVLECDRLRVFPSEEGAVSGNPVEKEFAVSQKPLTAHVACAG